LHPIGAYLEPYSAALFCTVGCPVFHCGLPCSACGWLVGLCLSDSRAFGQLLGAPTPKALSFKGSPPRENRAAHKGKIGPKIGPYIGPYGPYREGPISPKPKSHLCPGVGAPFGRTFFKHVSEILKINQKTTHRVLLYGGLSLTP